MLKFTFFIVFFVSLNSFGFNATTPNKEASIYSSFVDTTETNTQESKKISHKRLKSKELKVHWKEFIYNMDFKKRNPEVSKMNSIHAIA